MPETNRSRKRRSYNAVENRYSNLKEWFSDIDYMDEVLQFDKCIEIQKKFESLIKRLLEEFTFENFIGISNILEEIVMNMKSVLGIHVLEGTPVSVLKNTHSKNNIAQHPNFGLADVSDGDKDFKIGMNRKPVNSVQYDHGNSIHSSETEKKWCTPSIGLSQPRNISYYSDVILSSFLSKEKPPEKASIKERLYYEANSLIDTWEHDINLLFFQSSRKLHTSANKEIMTPSR